MLIGFTIPLGIALYKSINAILVIKMHVTNNGLETIYELTCFNNVDTDKWISGFFTEVNAGILLIFSQLIAVIVRDDQSAMRLFNFLPQAIYMCFNRMRCHITAVFPNICLQICLTHIMAVIFI